MSLIENDLENKTNLDSQYRLLRQNRPKSFLAKIVSSPLFWTAFILLGFSLPLVKNFGNKKVDPLPVYGKLPNFKLTDQNNKPFQLSDVSGAVLIVNFIFTSCPTTCPLLSSQMAKIQERSSGSGPAVKLLSISVDPKTDTPEVLKNYSEKYGARPSRWFFLTGDASSIEDVVVGGFKTALEDNSSESLMDIAHSEKFVLVDQIGQIRGYRDVHNDSDINKILRDVTILLNTDPRLAPMMTR